MAMTCVNPSRECDGCMNCEKEAETIGTCVCCGELVREDEDHYEIYGELVHEDCLLEWAEGFRVVSR